MSETARSDDAPDLGRDDSYYRCSECGEPILGISTTGPGEHRFTCGHGANGRFLTPPDVTGSSVAGLRVE